MSRYVSQNLKQIEFICDECNTKEIVLGTKDKDRDEEITKLRKDKEMLIEANGNLLQQISSESEEILSPKQTEAEAPKGPFNFESVFDKNGNFKKSM